jgi:glycine/D-amino acid oxidase-like deaminating enzyme
MGHNGHCRGRARRRGQLVTYCAVRSVEQSGGRISGVITERGLVACDAVVIAGWARAQDAFPALRAASIAQSWAGMIDVTPDALPVISPVEVVPGLHIATGFSGHGFGIGPGAGRLMADLVMGETPLVDPHDFRLSRFTDGSIIRPQSGY